MSDVDRMAAKLLKSLFDARANANALNELIKKPGRPTDHTDIRAFLPTFQEYIKSVEASLQNVDRDYRLPR